MASSNSKKGANESSGPLAFYGAGASLILTGTMAIEYGLGLIAVGGPVGIIGGGIVTTVGITMWFTGVGTVYLGTTVDAVSNQSTYYECTGKDFKSMSTWGAGVDLGY